MTFFSLQGLGDSILNFPALTSLRQKFDIEVLCFNNGSSSFFKAFHPRVKGVNTRTELLKEAFLRRTDAAYFCYPIWKKETASILLSRCPKRYFLSPPTRLGRTLWPKRPTSARWGHQLENNIALVEQILETPFEFRPDVELLAGSAVTSNSTRTLAIHPTASTPFKYYPLQFWKDLLSQVADRFDHLDLFCGRSDSELRFCQQIKQEAPKHWSLGVHQNLNFKALAQQLARAEYFVGSDSSLMHLAALLDKPLIGLWSFADYRTIFPYGNQANVYIPRETLTAKTHEYPTRLPAYLARASGQSVAEILQNRPAPSYTILPRTKNQVYFYTF